MAPNFRLFNACVMSLALLFTYGASGQNTTADEEATVASPVQQDSAPRETPVSEPRERPQPAAAATPSRSEPRVETPIRTEPSAEPVPHVAAAPESSAERAAAELSAQLPEKKRAATPTKSVPAAAVAQRSAKSDSEGAAPPKQGDTEAANPTAVAPALAPLPETAAISPRAVSNPTASATQVARATGPITSLTQSPAPVLPALRSDNDAKVTNGLTSFRYFGIGILLVLAAGLAQLGWRVFKYSEWQFPPGY